MCFSTLSCLHVNRPCFSETGQKFTMCARVPHFALQSGQEPMFLFPHLTRLSGEFKEFVHNLAANDITFRGIFLIILCHVTDCSSSTNNCTKSPCIVRWRTLLFHVSFTSSLIAVLTAHFVLEMFDCKNNLIKCR